MARRGFHDWSFAEDGNGADSEGDDADSPPTVNVYVAIPHASIKKAAGIIGIGRRKVRDLGQKPALASTDLSGDAHVKDSMRVLNFDLALLEASLKRSYDKKQGAIVVVGLGEVNTGALTIQIPAIRALCDRYDAWLHVDAAFSAFVSLLDEFEWISEHLRMADSICSDGHKQLNVPYDAGLFFIRKKWEGKDKVNSLLEVVCGLGKADTPAYLATARTQSNESGISQEEARRRDYAAHLPSPLFRNLENSKRFRALPLYATLLSEGRQGIKAMVQRNVTFARSIESWMRTSEGSKLYQVLTPRCDPLFTIPPNSSRSSSTSDKSESQREWRGAWTTTILLFRPHPTSCPVSSFRDKTSGAARCIAAIKATRVVYVSPAQWNGQGAIRLAVSNWRTGMEDSLGKRVQKVEESHDWKVTIETLRSVMNSSS